MADGYCVYAVVDWPDGTSDRSDRACPAGEIERATSQTRDEVHRHSDRLNVEMKTPN